MSKRVLVVDDEAIVRISCQRTLEPAGYSVRTAEDATEALDMLAAEGFDIIMTDLKMPNMDGLQFIQRARKLRPEACILLVTGFATDDAQQEAAVHGVSYLEKPFTPAMLLKKLSEMCA